jgi:DNA repair exonuclease SbcCD ATPase subunit
METATKINIPHKSKVRVIWEDDPQNYTKERQKRVAKYITEKYGVDNVQVVFKAKKIDTGNGEVEMTVADNVMDVNYQRKLFKEWLNLNKVEVDWDRILRLDDKVNEKLGQERDIDYRYRNWHVKKIEWDNFLSYGDGNVLSFDDIEGITVISSDPPNQGGKTVLALDLLLFLFFNTTTKGSTAIKMFNRFRKDKNEVRVKGTIMIDGVEYIIERRVIRKLKRDKISYTTKTDLSFSRIMADGSIQNLEGEQRRETDDLIKNSIGSVNDFLLTIITDADNLENIIHTKPTEKGRILSRFIGLEVLEDKETIVKEMKSKWSKGLKSDQHNTEDLKSEIREWENRIKDKEKEVQESDKTLEGLSVELTKARDKKESLLEKKVEIDTEIINLRPEDINDMIDKITKDGKVKKDNYEKAKADFEKMEEISYDEDSHNETIKDERHLSIEKGQKESEIRQTEKLIKSLEEGEFCPTCKQALADVDHTDEINENKGELVTLGENLTSLTKQLTLIQEDVKLFDDIKKKVSEYDRTSLMVDKLELDLNKMRLELQEKTALKTRFEQNLDNINKNKDLDTQILGYSSKISNLEVSERDTIRTKERLINDIANLNVSIDKNNETIKTIKVEEDIKIIFDLYIRMIGKNGISKLIMKMVMPLINSELDRLLIDTSNFKLFVDINDKNEVEFMIDKAGLEEERVTYPISEGSGFEKTISSLAIRVVMSKVSCLPKPNMIVFDEIFGKVAPENLELVGNFFQKCSEMFPNIFIITHIPQVKDWANKIITVSKKNEISSLTLN